MSKNFGITNEKLLLEQETFDYLKQFYEEEGKNLLFMLCRVYKKTSFTAYGILSSIKNRKSF
jgi:hypothetical protein